MEPIISPVDVSLIKKELTPDKLLRKTNKANNEIYIFSAHDAPNTMREVGRLREIAFRTGGGGTGAACDIDEFDTMENPYKQIIVWNPDEEEIIGGYRFFHGGKVQLDAKGQPVLSTAHLFHFSEKFIHDYLPYTIELGRSFVRVEYQSTQKGSKSLFALDNLWDGLGALTITYPHNTRYFFGKVTMYPDFDRQARDLILAFMKKYFYDKDSLVTPFKPIVTGLSDREIEQIFNKSNFKDDYKVLNAAVRDRDVNIPPLVNSYMGLSQSMKVFGTAINDEFGNVEETGILISVNEIEQDKQIRHIASFSKEESGVFWKLMGT
ncbi:MAG: GNAT family N-acetyltransferase [Prevotellaceae bacterium]|jgi:hypothetical protein|nr:GNAT family N-acetyltransferase [Prevotellaceae bacterium]